ncbi:uncharacterized protein LOC119107812 isoform X2 [Pollicipes pollicipes]|uniref:uncharacterized protein LOC119107812 isoform X2 n=1 Tax=Pollicipes pollicipes TaxID=41117 RepID=UPI00188584E3|nr:uncharacterized protein LOC119107812 isoform X2 [Pollicipes pollicipes]
MSGHVIRDRHSRDVTNNALASSAPATAPWAQTVGDIRSRASVSTQPLLVSTNGYFADDLRCYYKFVAGVRCPATAVMKDDALDMRRGHCHEPMPLDAEMAQVVVQLRQAVQQGGGLRTNRHLFDQAAVGEAGAAIGYPAARQILMRERRRNHPATPQTPAQAAHAIEAAVPGIRRNLAFTITTDDGQAAICLAADDVVASAVAHPNLDIQADGTFRMVPRQFHQLLVVFVATDGVILPAFWVLASCRTRDMYGRILAEIGRRLPAPVRFMSDWERALQAAAAAVWPNSSINGCWFHYAQAVLRQIRRHGLLATYERPHWECPSARWARKLLVLPLVPARHLHTAWKLLLDPNVPEVEPELEPQVTRLEAYVARQWRALPADRLSVHGLERRTNNDAESFFCWARCQHPRSPPQLLAVRSQGQQPPTGTPGLQSSASSSPTFARGGSCALRTSACGCWRRKRTPAPGR